MEYLHLQTLFKAQNVLGGQCAALAAVAPGDTVA
jgi:hypothetical protein